MTWTEFLKGNEYPRYKPVGRPMYSPRQAALLSEQGYVQVSPGVYQYLQFVDCDPDTDEENVYTVKIGAKHGMLNERVRAVEYALSCLHDAVDGNKVKLDQYDSLVDSMLDYIDGLQGRIYELEDYYEDGSQHSPDDQDSYCDLCQEYH